MNDKKTSNDEPGLDPAIQKRLGEKLRETYSEMLDAPVPDKFVDLLNRLEQTDKKKPS